MIAKLQPEIIIGNLIPATTPTNIRGVGERSLYGLIVFINSAKS